jgi:hypothetical protein
MRSRQSSAAEMGTCKALLRTTASAEMQRCSAATLHRQVQRVTTWG